MGKNHLIGMSVHFKFAVKNRTLRFGHTIGLEARAGSFTRSNGFTEAGEL